MRSAVAQMRAEALNWEFDNNNENVTLKIWLASQGNDYLDNATAD